MYSPTTWYLQAPMTIYAVEQQSGSWSQPLRGGPDNLPSKGRMRPTRQAPPQRIGPQVRPGRWLANRFSKEQQWLQRCPNTVALRQHSLGESSSRLAVLTTNPDSLVAPARKPFLKDPRCFASKAKTTAWPQPLKARGLSFGHFYTDLFKGIRID